MVTNARQVLDTAAADQHDRVLLQVVTDTGNISGNLVTVGQTHTGDLTQSGVRLLRGGGTHSSADASLLRRRQVSGTVLQGVDALLECRSRGFVSGLFSTLSYKLIKSRHDFSSFLE